MSTIFLVLVAVFVSTVGMGAQASGDIGWALVVHALVILIAAAAGYLARD